MMLMLCPVASERLDCAIVPFYWNLEPQDIVTCHDVLQHVWSNVCLGGSLVYIELHLL